MPNKPRSEKQLLNLIERKQNKLDRLNGKAFNNQRSLRLNEGINGSWKKFRNACTSAGNASAVENEIKALKAELAEVRTNNL